jgi:hypothetical protein
MIDRRNRMKIPRFGVMQMVVGMLMLLPLSISPTPLSAQCTGSKGNNAVYASCGLQGSTAFIDAGAFSSTGDICARIHAVLTTSYPASGAVIDARGIRPPSGSSQTCSTNPWAGISAPSTVLLPSGTIQISVQWILPSGTRIVGEGAGSPGAGVTTIQAASGFTHNLSIIKMGAAAGATGVSVEDLALDGNSVTGVSGISNSFARDLSYVKHVSLSNIAGNGLLLLAGSQNSGPYSDINFSSTVASAVCVSIQGAATSTRGIHGLTCTGNPSGAALPVAVLLDAPNNTLEDVRITGFTDGIKIGQNLPTQSDVLSNISGGTNVSSVVHITNTHLVTDLSIVGLAKNGATTAINDQESLPSTNHLIADSTVAIYVLGEQVTETTGGSATIIGFSRFTTSKTSTTPTWATGGAAISAGTACTQPGSLYSNTTGSINGGLGHGNTWYLCEGNPSTWSNIY